MQSPQPGAALAAEPLLAVPDCHCPQDPGGCAEARSASGFALTYYRGFSAGAAVAPRDGEPELLFRQEGVYHTGGGDRRPPATRFTLRLQDPRTGKDVLLQVDNTPQDPVTFKGPIRRITVELGDNPAGEVENNCPCKVFVAAHREQVIRITVEGPSPELCKECPPEAHAAPGRRVRRGREDEGEEPVVTSTWTIENNAQTCPAECEDG